MKTNNIGDEAKSSKLLKINEKENLNANGYELLKHTDYNSNKDKDINRVKSKGLRQEIMDIYQGKKAEKNNSSFQKCLLSNDINLNLLNYHSNNISEPGKCLDIDRISKQVLSNKNNEKHFIIPDVTN